MAFYFTLSGRTNEGKAAGEQWSLQLVYQTMKRPNIANWLSIYRIAAVPVIVIAILFDQKEVAGWLLFVSFATDIADGMFARKLNMETESGASLDSAGDMLTFLAGLFGVYMFGTAHVLDHLMIIGFGIVLYLSQFLIGLIKYKRSSSLHTYSAKIAALVQGMFIIVFHLHQWVEWLFWAAIIISIVETLEEIIIIFMLPKWETNVKGLYWVAKRRNKG